MNQHPNYEIFEEIGKGTTASVYRAHDLSLKRDVAIKELNEKLRKDPRRLQDFWDEAQFLAGLRHENIVQIHAIDQERGWIIMELMRNSLDNLVDTKGLPPDLVRSVLQQALEALTCLHERSKLHAGIRPASLLIDDQGRIKLSDSAGITVGGEFRKPTGSSKYLAPELVNPQFGEVGPGLDLYNLGFAALELLLGRQAFEKYFKGVGPGAVDPEIGWMRWHSSIHEKLPPLKDLLPNLPEDMRRVLDRLTRKEVNQRYTSAAAALEDLESRDLVLVKEEDRTRKAGRRAQDGPAVVAIGAAPPPPPPPPVFNPAPPSKGGPPPRTKPTAPAGSKPWSKDWINQQLKKPAILIPLLLLILLPVVYVLFFMEGEPEPTERVNVTIDSNPRGAKVLIHSGEKWLKLPNPTKTTYPLPAGDYKIRLELPKHKQFEGTIKVVADKTFEFNLVPETATAATRNVTLESDPTGAEIYIDDKKLDKVTGQEIEVPNTPYKLKLVYKGKTLVERTINGPEDEKTVFRAAKEPTRVVEIRSEPPGAYVYLNGVKQDKATPNKFDAPPAPVDIVLKKEGFKDFFQRFDTLPPNLPLFKLEIGKPGTRLVYIGSEPDGATVFIDDVKQSKKTPSTFEVPDGPFKLRLERGKRTLERTLAKAADKEIFPLPVVLRPLFIETKPAGATVYINGEKQDKPTNDTYMVPDEPFDLKLEGPGDIPGVITHILPVNPEKLDKKLLHSFLRKMHLTSTPAGATVFIDGVKQEKKTNDIFEVPAIPFSLRLELEDRKIEVPIDPKTVAIKKDPKSKVPIPEVELTLPPPGLDIVLKTTPVGAQIIIATKEAAVKATGPAKVNLPEGVYPIEIKAKGFATYRGKLRVDSSSREQEFTLKSVTANQYALMVGVRDYGGAIPDFLHAESDAAVLSHALRAAEFSSERIFLLSQALGKMDAASAPTSENILDKLKFLADTCTEADTVWVGLFGQVLSTKEGDFFWPDKGDRTNPKTLVPLAQVLKELQRCAAETKILLIDGWRHSYADGVVDQPQSIREFRPKAEQLHGTLFVASTQGGQTGYDHLYKRHGLFGLAVFRGLTGAADQNGDDKISGTELDVYLHKEVNRMAKELYAAQQNVAVEAPGLNPGALMLSKVTPTLKLYGQGLTAQERGNSKEALDYFQKSLKADAQFAPAYIGRGEASFQLGNKKEAMDDWKVAVKLNPHDGLAWSHLGDAQFELKDPDAFNSHAHAIEREPSFALGYRDRGLLYLNGVEVDRAGKRFKTAESGPNLEKSLDDLRKATKLNTKLDLAWHDLGRAYVLQTDAGTDQYEAAIQSFGKALETSTKPETAEAAMFERAEAFRQRASHWASVGDPGEKKYREDLKSSLKDYSELVNFKSTYKDRYYNMQGALNEQLGNLREAAASFEAATKQNPMFKQAYLNLGAVYNKLAEYEKAIPALEQAIKIDPNFGKAHAYLFASYTFRAKNELDPTVRADLEEKAARHHKIAKLLGAIK